MSAPSLIAAKYETDASTLEFQHDTMRALQFRVYAAGYRSEAGQPRQAAQQWRRVAALADRLGDAADAHAEALEKSLEGDNRGTNPKHQA